MKKYFSLSILFSVLLFSLSSCSNEPKNVCDCVKLIQDASSRGGKIEKTYNQLCNKFIREKTGISDISNLKVRDWEKYYKLVNDCTGEKVPVPIEGTYSNGDKKLILYSDGTATMFFSKEKIKFKEGESKKWSGTPEDLRIEFAYIEAYVDKAVVTFSGIKINDDLFLERQELD